MGADLLTGDLPRILPELILAVFGTLIVLIEPFLPRDSKALLGHIGLIGVLSALLSTYVVASKPGLAFGGLVIVDAFSVYVRILILIITALALVASFAYLERYGRHQGEFYALMLFAAVGMGLLAAANELVFLFLALETSSIATYVLVGFRRKDLRSMEASLKYFLLGSFATAILLYGVALLYGATGSTRIPAIAEALRDGTPSAPLVLMGMALLLVGFGFKVAAAPLQVWTPDVYEGAPTPVAAFLATAPKAAALAAFLRVFTGGLHSLGDMWFWILWASALLTMLVGNFGALLQTNVKRMLAYSSIAHAGYLLIAFAARNELGRAALLFYLVAYAFMKLGAFTAVSCVSADEQNQGIGAYAGLHKRNPFVAFSLTVFLLSLIGIPLTGGFLGKLYIFQAGLEAHLLGLVILGALNSVLSAGYYLKVVKAMYMDEPADAAEPAPVPASVSFALTLTVLATILLGIFPGPVLQLAELSARSLP